MDNRRKQTNLKITCVISKTDDNKYYRQTFLNSKQPKGKPSKLFDSYEECEADIPKFYLK